MHIYLENIKAIKPDHTHRSATLTAWSSSSSSSSPSFDWSDHHYNAHLFHYQPPDWGQRWSFLLFFKRMMRFWPEACTTKGVQHLSRYLLVKLKIPLNGSSFKHAVIQPLIKKTNLDRTILSNFQPISKSSFVYKCLLSFHMARIHDTIVNAQVIAKEPCCSHA